MRKDIYRDGLLHVANVLFENRRFQDLVENLCNMIDAVEAKRLFDAVPFGASYDAAVQEINEQHSHSESMLDYLKAQNMLNGSNIPDAITDAFMFGQANGTDLATVAAQLGHVSASNTLFQNDYGNIFILS